MPDQKKIKVSTQYDSRTAIDFIKSRGKLLQPEGGRLPFLLQMNRSRFDQIWLNLDRLKIDDLVDLELRELITHGDVVSNLGGEPDLAEIKVILIGLIVKYVETLGDRSFHLHILGLEQMKVDEILIRSSSHECNVSKFVLGIFDTDPSSIEKETVKSLGNSILALCHKRRSR